MPLPLTEDEKNRLFMTLDAQTRQLERLDRGMYGDEKLRQPGLIDDMIEVKKWIMGAKLKITFLSGIGMTIGFLLSRAWEWFVGKH